MSLACKVLEIEKNQRHRLTEDCCHLRRLLLLLSTAYQPVLSLKPQMFHFLVVLIFCPSFLFHLRFFFRIFHVHYFVR